MRLGTTIPALPVRDVAASRAFYAGRPVVSGAESFLAGTASCRISVEGLDELYGAREFHVLDLDGNLLTFYFWPS